MTRHLVLVGTFLAGVVAVPCKAPGDEPDPSREARFERLIENLPQYRLQAANADEPFERLPEPVLRWTNPVRRTNDAGVFLWTDRGRAAAILCTFCRNDTECKYEWQSLSDDPFTMTFDGNAVWEPNQGGVAVTTLAKPPVAPSPRLRLIQMREIVRRYEARIGKNGEAEPLRMLRQPLHRYPEKIGAPGVVDGALFAFVQATDPEVLVRLEARTDDGGEPRWTVGFARTSRWNQTVIEDGRTVWSVDWTPGRRDGTYTVLTYQSPKTPE